MSMLHFCTLTISTLDFTQKNDILEDYHIVTMEISIPQTTDKVEGSSQLVNNLNIAWYVKRHKKGNQF